MSVAFIVNGGTDGAIGHRARAFAARLRDRYAIRTAFRSGRRLGALVEFVAFLFRTRPAVVYVFDMAVAGVLATALYKLLVGAWMIVDTGDAIYELVRSSGVRGPLGAALTRWFEHFSLWVADCVVVRGTRHQQYLASRGVDAVVIQDGVDVTLFAPQPDGGLRAQYGLDGWLTVGLVGASVWSQKLHMAYGWDLIEALRLLGPAPVKGVIIGDGSGIPRLKQRARDYGLADRVLFLGRVPYEELPRYLGLIDVCLSTQTNNLAGQVRTTGKLPLYLACGRYILASKVGEAALVLDEEMLVDYQGARDDGYPARLAGRIRALLDDPEFRTRALRNVAVARERFEYAVLAEKAAAVIEAGLGARLRRPAVCEKQT